MKQKIKLMKKIKFMKSARFWLFLKFFSYAYKAWKVLKKFWKVKYFEK